jgi:hypothetical protein
VEEEGRRIFERFQEGFGMILFLGGGPDLILEATTQEYVLVEQTQGPFLNLVRNRGFHLREFNPRPTYEIYSNHVHDKPSLCISTANWKR